MGKETATSINDTDYTDLAQLEERFRLALGVSDVGVWDRDLTSNTEYWSDEYYRLYGVERTQFGSTYEAWLSLVHPEDQKLADERASQAIASGQQYVVEFRIRHPTKGLRWIAESGRPVSSSPGSPPDRMLGIAVDVTERKNAEVRLALEHAVTRVLSQSGDLEDALPKIIETMREHLEALVCRCILYQPDAQTRSFVSYDAHNLRIHQFLSRTNWLAWVEEKIRETGRALYVPHIASSSVPFRDLAVSSRIESLGAFPIEVDGSLLGIIEFLCPAPLGEESTVSGMMRAMGSEIAQFIFRKRAEETLREHRDSLELLVAERTRELQASNERLLISERMASLGTLAAGLGHDMGNLLFPLRTRLSLLQKRVAEDRAASPELREDLEAIQKATDYLQNLCRGLRLLALNPEEGAAKDEETDIPQWWSEVSALFKTILPRGVDLRADLASDTPRVAIAKHSLTQIIFNLVQNAGDVLKGRDGAFVRVYSHVEDDQVAIVVKDNGPGMTDEVKTHCLEPFFTTKPRGVSTGLGLSLVHKILQAVGGNIELASTLGEGTEFTVRVPVSKLLKRRPGNTLALIAIDNQRMAAFVQSLFSARGITAQVWREGEIPENPDFVVVESTEGTSPLLNTPKFRIAKKPPKAIIIGGDKNAPAFQDAYHVDSIGDVKALREAVERVVTSSIRRVVA